MAESNATQVILTDDGIKIIKAQSTADSAAGGVANLNDPNLMSVIEKQNNIGQFAGLTSQYNVIIQNAKDDGIDTTAAVVAYNNLSQFMADILADPDHASDVDRVTYKKYQDAYNGELAKLQNALQNNTNNKFTSAANATSQAVSTANAAKSAADSTYDYANSEIAVQSNATAKAQSAADNAFSQAQATSSQASSEIAVQSNATAKAQSTADSAFSQATTALDTGQAVSQAVTALKDGSTLTIAELGNGLAAKVSNSEYASYKVQTASQIGQMVTNGAFSAYQQTTADLISSKVATKDFTAYQATTADAISSKVASSDFNTYKTQTANLIDDKVSSSEYASDKTQTASQIAQMVSNSAFSTYQTQTASQIASKVDNGDFSTYKTQTANLISSKVANSYFSAYQATTATAISSKVASSDFNTYKQQTSDAIISKVSKKDANNVNLIPYSAMPKANNLRWFETGGGGTLSVTTHSFYHNSADPLYVLSTARSNEVFAISPRFKINANTTYTFQLKGFASSNVSSMDVFVLGRKNGETQDYTVVNQIIAGAKLSNSGLDYRTVTFTTGAIDEAYIRVDNNGSADGKTSTLLFTELKLEPGDTATPYVYGAEDTMIAQTADDILLRVTKDDLIDQINIQAGNTLISSSGQLTLSGKNIYFDTNNPVMIPSANIDTVLVGKKLTAADISANTFTTNNGTFTVDKNGAITAKNMTIIGGTLTSPTINASTINGSTINGTTFNAGTQLNSYGNTSYPLTISSDGSVESTISQTNSGITDILRTRLRNGQLNTNFRRMSPYETGKYLAADTTLGIGQLSLYEGYSTSADANFSVDSLKATGYTILDAGTGLSLHGSTQGINFGGADLAQTTGITMNSYGNIIGYSNSTWWRIVSNSGSNVANFGIDRGGSNVIQFNRELDIGNFQINTGHTFTSADGGAIHFAKGRGGANDIYAGDVHYNSLVKSSLLSVKKDVKKADTAYWAQLVNSIDLATYQYKTDDNTSHIRLSSIVDDVHDTKQWQLPDVFISRDEDGKLCGVDDSVLLNATLATVQEQQKEIDKLNGHLLELEAKLNG